MKIICKLERERAVEIIKDTESVMYKHGVWNPYEEANTDYVIKRIMNSGYGADVFCDDDGKYYVQIPCDSDMW